MSKLDNSGQIVVDGEGASMADSSASEFKDSFKVDSEYRESKDSFSKIFGAYKRQYAGVVKEYKSKQEYRSRSERRKLKDETSRKRTAKRSKSFDSRNRRYF